MTDIKDKVYNTLSKWENGDILLSKANEESFLSLLALWSKVNELHQKEHKALDVRDMKEAFKLSEQRRDVMIEILSYEIMISRTLIMENQ
tara:strand:+ start:350 stop:619 length:270 start_codon:yes stop_codon:yes gene_type:complete